MANNHYESNGVLVLDKVTPVIQALFGQFALDPTLPGNGEAYIRTCSDSYEPQWEELLEDLAQLAANLGLHSPGYDAKEILDALLSHFVKEPYAQLGRDLIESIDVDNGADLDDLFALANLFDDGHGLKAMRIEGCWSSSKARLFEFGGDGVYRSSRLRIRTSSSQALALGSAIDNALASQDQDAAAEFVAAHVNDLLDGLADNNMRQAILRGVATKLAAPVN